MNGTRTYEARPFFRVLAAVLALAGWFAVAMSLLALTGDGPLSVAAMSIPMALFALTMSMVVVKGRAPRGSRWFLASPPAVDSDDKDPPDNHPTDA